MADYNALVKTLAALTENVPYRISNLANAAALLWDAMEEINWAGFYLWEDGKLILGPFQGKVACVEISSGKGVCGTAFEKDEVQLVPDVHRFPGHIACDSASNSEIVIPLHKNGKPVAVLDIDSTVFSRFTEQDREGLCRFARKIEEIL